jgi:hypothetical protein
MGTNVSTFHYLISKLGGLFLVQKFGQKRMNWEIFLIFFT